MNFKAKYFDELSATELYEILKSRAEVFLLEQKIICQDMDDVDYTSLHCFLHENDRVVAYLRAFCEDNDKMSVNVGRVLTIEHNKGLGKQLMEKSIAEIKKHFSCTKISIHSQKHAIGFYKKFGFEVTSDEFLEEGVVHVTMERSL